MIVVTIDCETDLISAESALPEVICMVAATRVEGQIVKQVYAGLDDVYDAFTTLLDDPDVLIVNQTLCYDLAVLYASLDGRDPTLITRIFDALASRRMVDIAIREKLITLGTYGDIEFMTMKDGSTRRAEYSLAALGMKYLGKKRQGKGRDEASWRTNFKLLRGLPVEDYPDEALEYLYEDASDPLEIYEMQEEVIESEGLRDHMDACQYKRTEFDFCLKLISAWGFDTDEAYKQELQARVDEEYHSVDSMKLCLKHGLLRPPVPARPHKNNPNKFTKPKKASKNTKLLREYIKSACEQHGVDVRYTETELVSCGQEVLADLEGHDPVIDEFIARNKLEKLATTELPRMSGGRIVRPNFDVLKKSGRISSYAGKDSPYPAFNCQNVDPRARNAFVARPGHVIVSCDYSANELVAAAQTYIRVVGWSVLADVINAGVDTHAYLGAQLAIYLDERFRARAEAEGCKTPMDVYHLLVSLKDSPNEDDVKFYKHYRKFAKPTGLGYPGGLGPKTFVGYAKATYGVEVDEETARVLREIWRDTYPEVRLYFKWVNHSCVDPRQNDRYCYTSPMGMVRAGCMYTEAANGAALQTPSAEWMMVAVIRIVREQYDPALGSCLLGTHTLGPVHDEILAEIPEDEFMTQRACRIAAIMIEAGKEAAPDLTHRVEPALMYRWDKAAETVWNDETETLEVWEPRHDS